MNPHAKHSYNLKAIGTTLYHNKNLIFQLLKRELTGRYKGSILGIAWSFFQPLLMLVVYTFVFSVVLKTTWRDGIGNETVSFAIILFSGLIIHGFFAECINRAPTIILHNTNLVKRVVFPLEILPVITIGVAIFNSMVGMVILFGAMLLSGLEFHSSSLYLPLLFFPLILMTLGITWIVASIGVFLRDMDHAVVVITTILLFLSPVFYPLSAIPEQFRNIIYLNPLTFIVNQVRTVLIWGTSPSWLWLIVYSLISLFIAWLGFCLFQYMRKGFSDVL